MIISKPTTWSFQKTVCAAEVGPCGISRARLKTDLLVASPFCCSWLEVGRGNQTFDHESDFGAAETEQTLIYSADDFDRFRLVTGK